MNEADVKTKSDNELLDILVNQIEYRGDVVEWVKTEIGSRGLEVSKVHVRTREEYKRERTVSGAFANVKIIAFFQGVVGLLLTLIAISLIKDEIQKAVQPLSGGPSLTGPIVVLAVGVLMAAFSIAVFKRKRWAFILGFYWYVTMTVINLIVAIATGNLIMGAVAIGISVSLALCFDTLRKSVANKRGA